MRFILIKNALIKNANMHNLQKTLFAQKFANCSWPSAFKDKKWNLPNNGIKGLLASKVEAKIVENKSCGNAFIKSWQKSSNIITMQVKIEIKSIDLNYYTIILMMIARQVFL